MTGIVLWTDNSRNKTDVSVSDIITVLPGEKIPIDGYIEEGESALNTSALTGESLPRDVKAGDEVISGCINLTGVLKIRTTKEFGESTVSKILELVESSSSNKSRSEAFISRFAKIYTPAVVFSALALAVIPPLFSMLILHTSPLWNEWIYRALTFLVISCPCALVISIPLSFFAGLGGASKEGILIKGSKICRKQNMWYSTRQALSPKAYSTLTASTTIRWMKKNSLNMQHTVKAHPRTPYP